MSTNPTESSRNFFLNREEGRWISGFLLLGTLVGSIGSLLIVWQYHISAEPRLIGLHFLSLNAGYVAGVALAQSTGRRASVRVVACSACVLAVLAWSALFLAAPPAAPFLRILGLALVGLSAGVLAAALLSALDDLFAEAFVVVAQRAAVLFGCGNLLATAIVGSTYFAGSVQIETLVLAVVPLLYLLIFASKPSPRAKRSPEIRHKERQSAEASRQLRNIGAVLFSLLIFLQFGNEWAIAGWLPLFLIHRFGTNPVWAIWALAAFFLVLTFGRVLVRGLLSRFSHRKLLLGGTALAMTGCLTLSLTSTLSSAWTGIVLAATGFAPLYPLIAERLDDRFAYHPGFYNRIFSIAITGAMSAPWLLGFVDSAFGIRFVMLFPAFGSIAVLVCALMLILEARLMGDKQPAPSPRVLRASGE